jgi:hypothetical protein
MRIIFGIGVAASIYGIWANSWPEYIAGFVLFVVGNIFWCRTFQ